MPAGIAEAACAFHAERALARLVQSGSDEASAFRRKQKRPLASVAEAFVFLQAT
jgi:hypothetical protein